MDNDQVLLVLLAVRMQGGQAPATGDLLKPLKAGIKLAREKGFLTEGTANLPSTSKAGKTTMKKTAVLVISEQGENFLRQAASPDALAATAAGQVQALQKRLEADRLALREEVLKAVSAKGGKAKTDLGKVVEEIRKRLEKVEAALQNQGQEGLVERIDQGFAALQKRLEASLAKSSGSPVQKPTSPGPVPESLQNQLHKAYQKLCQFVEFEDGLVEIPRLYHEARRMRPELTVEGFHTELDRLWSERILELKVLNEVRSAAEPDKGIRRGDNLYYFVYWRSP